MRLYGVEREAVDVSVDREVEWLRRVRQLLDEIEQQARTLRALTGGTSPGYVTWEEAPEAEREFWRDRAVGLR